MMSKGTLMENKHPIDRQLDQDLGQGLLDQRSGIIEEIYSAYAARLRQVVWPVLHDHVEVEDVLQDVLMYAHDKSQQFDCHRGALFSWLSTIARRRAIDRLRQRMARQRAKDGFEEEQREVTAQRTTVESTVARSANNRDLRKLFGRMLSRLPDSQEQVIRMKFYEYLSQREIAARMNTSPSTVRTRIELGMKKLKESVDSMGAAVA